MQVVSPPLGSKVSVDLKTRALTKSEVAALAGEFAEFAAGLIDSAPSYPMSEYDMALVGQRVLLERTDIVDAIVAVAAEIEQADAAALSPFRKLPAVIAIVSATRVAHGSTALWATVRPAIAQYSGVLSQVRH